MRAINSNATNNKQYIHYMLTPPLQRKFLQWILVVVIGKKSCFFWLLKFVFKKKILTTTFESFSFLVWCYTHTIGGNSSQKKGNHFDLNVLNLNASTLNLMEQRRNQKKKIQIRKKWPTKISNKRQWNCIICQACSKKKIIRNSILYE